MFVCKHSIMGSHRISFLLWSDRLYLRLLEKEIKFGKPQYSEIPIARYIQQSHLHYGSPITCNGILRISGVWYCCRALYRVLENMW